MRMNIKSRALIGTVVTGAVCCFVAGSWMWREAKVNKLLPQETSARRVTRRLTSLERNERTKRQRHFEQLWQTRRQRDVNGGLVALLQDPVLKEATYARVDIVRALGRLESPAVQDALMSVLRESQGLLRRPNPSKPDGDNLGRLDKDENDSDENDSDDLMYMQSQLALGRMRARDMQGSQKINTFLGEAGLSFGDVVRLSQKINPDPKKPKHIYTEGTPGNAALNETVDVLYEMRKQGEDVSFWQDQLTLRKAQQLMLQGAALPEAQEIDLLLDYLGQVKVYTDADLSQHLIDINPSAASAAAIERLEDLRDHPGKYRNAACYAFFRIPEAVKDRRALPVLKQIEQLFLEEARTNVGTRGYWLDLEASRSIESIEKAG